MVKERYRWLLLLLEFNKLILLLDIITYLITDYKKRSDI